MGISELSGTTILSVLCILLMIAFVSLGALHIITERRHRQELYCYDDEKDGLFSTPSSPTSVPEIRLTFPDDAERDASKQVIVQVSAAGCAFVRDVPQDDGFKELHLDDLGGLKE